jgi:phosphatidylglycerophosphatase A
VNAAALLLAQGLGLGRLPGAPGTYGSVLGLVWVAVLLAPANGLLYFLGTLAGLGLSVALSSYAERRLQQKDPPSVVLDEITALPVCWFGPQGLELVRHGHALRWETLWADGGWVWTLAGFAAFRLFDIWKPWPVRQSQRLPGGWGVTVDDALAAVYVSSVWLVGLLASGR